MSVKKILLLGAAGAVAVAMSSAMAGGYTSEPASFESGYYVEGHAGYARQNYFDNAKWRQHTGIATVNNGNERGGFSGGVDLGYKINHNYAVELGWFHLPSVNVNMQNVAATSAWMKSWALYLAAKYMMPLNWMSDTNLFFKLGVMYRDAVIPTNAVVWTTPVIAKRTTTFVRPMFAAGLDYAFSHEWTGVFQYAYFMGARASFPVLVTNARGDGYLGTVDANVFTLGLAYNFNV